MKPADFVRFRTIALAMLLLLARADAQQLTRVTPAAAAPGDIVIITGSNLGATTIVRFGANVGGFAGFWVIQVAPTQVTPTAVTATVPTFANFLPPGPNGSTPIGTIDTGGPGFSNSLSLFYMEQTQGQILTPGLGTTQGGLLGRPVVGFTISGGPPVTGNAAFTLTLENATPLATCILVLGSPAIPATAPYLDGVIGLDLAQPIIVIQPSFTVNQSGDMLIPSPIPATPFTATVAVVWIVVDPVSGAPGISNALSVAL